MANIFGGSMFGGGGFMGQAQSQVPGMQFGGGFIMNPMAQAQTTQEVQLNPQGALTYAVGPYGGKRKDRSGRLFYASQGGSVHRQKRY
jgi:hypothetical protein